jgi:RNA polymerase sigma-70 factor (ECF subfamily)
MTSSYAQRASATERSVPVTGRRPSSPPAQPDSVSGQADSPWPDLVRRLREGQQSAMEDLYRVFSDGIRLYLWRQLGPQDLNDKVHDLFLIVTDAIRNGDLREPERLMGYVRTVVRRQVAGHIHVARLQRRSSYDLDLGTALLDVRSNPEHHVIRCQYNDVAQRILSAMRQREREVLIRFYMNEQPAEDICREMELTATQFRLLKSRAKARFGDLCRSRLSHGVRTRAASASRY